MDFLRLSGDRALQQSPQEGITQLKRQISNEATFNVDEESKLLRSIEELESTRKDNK